MRLPFTKRTSTTTAGFAISSEQIDVLLSPKAFSERLFSLISAAKKRIYLTALYLQDDIAGRAILDALYQAVAANPELEVKVFVDFHRAQRGLIGEKECLGNRALYQKLENKAPDQVKIYGVPVKGKELFGVLHLKGFVFDDVVLYTGASINDVYMHQGDKYRYDRYYQLTHVGLANAMVEFLARNFVRTGCAPRIDLDSSYSKKRVKQLTAQLRRITKTAQYQLSPELEKLESSDYMSIVPLMGFGKRNNQLNITTRNLVKNAEQSIVLITPYFNLPKPLLADVVQALKRGVKVTIVVGDKTANDFYLPPEQPFTTIGIVPYLYERLLAKFVTRFARFVDSGLLSVNIWHHKNNSFHLKGLVVDETYHLVTGSNMNPRAWNLDMENGLLIGDANQQLLAKWQEELATILAHTTELKSPQELDAIGDYPAKPQALLKKLKVAQIDRLLKRFL